MKSKPSRSIRNASLESVASLASLLGFMCMLWWSDHVGLDLLLQQIPNNNNQSLPTHDNTSAATFMDEHKLALAKKDAEIEQLKWQLNMLQARPFPGISYPLENGLAAMCVPAPVLEQMGHYNQRKVFRHIPPDPPLPPEHDAGQVGKFVFENMVVDNTTRRPVWTKKIWDHLTTTLAKGRSIAVPGYPGSDVDLMAAYRHVYQDLENRNASKEEENHVLDAAVFSSISPWAEATLHHVLGSQARITSVDFNPCVLSSDLQEGQIQACLSPDQLRSRQGPSFDVVVSFSGIEHDGLGRYGDPVDPNGDLGAMKEFWLHLRPGGYLFLAVPTGGQNQHQNHPSGAFLAHWGNGHLKILRHRMYTPTRFAKLFRGFVFEGWVDKGEFHPYQGEQPPGSGESGFCPMENAFAAFQPVLILRKDSNATFDEIFLDTAVFSK